MVSRDFPSAPTEKVRGAGAADAPASMLGLESGGEWWLVDLADADEVLPVPALSEVPLTRPWFRGIANIRGMLYGVSDLAAFHGGAPTTIRMQTRLLLAGAHAGRHRDSHIALLMSGTQGLKSLESLERLGPEAAAVPTQPWRGERWRDGDGRVWTHLRLPLLLGAAEFLDIAA